MSAKLFPKKIYYGKHEYFISRHKFKIWSSKKVHLIFVPKKTLFWSCSWRFIFIYSRTKKRVFVISDRKQSKYSYIRRFFSYNYYQIWRTPLFDPAVDRNKHSTTRPDQCFFGQKSVDLFLASYIENIWRKYFIHILSMIKFCTVYLFSERLNKLDLARIS